MILIGNYDKAIKLIYYLLHTHTHIHIIIYLMSYYAMYLILSVLCVSHPVFATFIATLSLYIGTLRAARFIHDGLLKQVIRAPMEFFDTTLTGRILNRFSNDTKEVDNDLPATLRAFGACCFGVFEEFLC
jgi:ABC-type multidrug transport system fused ATPase/permease subunit